MNFLTRFRPIYLHAIGPVMASLATAALPAQIARAQVQTFTIAQSRLPAAALQSAMRPDFLQSQIFQYTASGRALGYQLLTACSNRPQYRRQAAYSLIKFTARLVEEQVMLDWVTEMESGASHFTIQCSLDGEVFNDKGILFTQGNSPASKTYHFSDRLNHAASIYLYYRLKMVDMDARSRYSEIVTLRVPRAQQISNLAFYPMPSSRDLRITLGGGGARQKYAHSNRTATTDGPAPGQKPCWPLLSLQAVI